MNKSFNPVILEQFGAIIGKVHSFSFPKRQGATSEVIFLHTDNGQFVCKVAQTSLYREWLLEEARIMKHWNEETNLPIPTFYQFVENNDESYLLMSLENGIPLREALLKVESDKERYDLLECFGALLKQLHETKPPTSWVTKESWLDEQLEKATYNLQNYDVDGDQPLLDNLKRHKPVPFEQTLIHGDCTIDNILVSNGRVRTFIDLAGSAFGDPRYDIALAIRSIRNNEKMLNAFYKGYGLRTITKEEFDYFDGGLYEFF
ncbi:aminoglycoside phosphotransferase family protein [Psychrobacillus glaciei]|uniref:Aminoglycoside phosphotransferase family protein n=1 Tax=Psychrobacillus glaciei TaxID=2283160 RepID=A0A5J6SSK3_9BACI|nr:aminoglycoside phosphotransferase family protein [Psychrobacillus glaciei]QFF99187.1 aminoglycoside phosphotransferase family protein [Psychrobacillus glaciei]